MPVPCRYVGLSGWLLPVVCLLVSSLSLSAGNASIRFRHLKLSDGISQSSVEAIEQDDQGFMWLGTLNGLNRYDGYQFVRFIADGREGSLTDSQITTLLNAQDTLWVGTRRGGFLRFDPDTRTFRRIMVGNQRPGEQEPDHILNVSDDRQGRIWVATEQGLSRINPEDGAVLLFLNEKSYPLSLKHRHINAMFQNEDGILWLGTEQGINRLHPELHPIGLLEETSPYDRKIHAMTSDHQDRIIIASDREVFVLDPNARRRTLLQYEKDEQLTVTALHAQGPKRLWVGTRYQGLLCYQSGKEGEYRVSGHYRYDRGALTGLSGDTVNTLFEDRSGVLWIGTGSGISLLTPNAHQFQQYHHQADNENSLSHGMVWSITDDTRGDIWIGNWGGLDRLDADTQTLRRFDCGPVPDAGIEDNQIRALYRDGETVWAGSLHGWIGRFDPKEQKGSRLDMTFYRKCAEDPDRNIAPVYGMLRDRQGMFWVATEDGLRFLDQDSGLMARPEPADHSDPFTSWIFCMVEDQQGVLWFGTEKDGLKRVLRKKDGWYFRRYDKLLGPDREDQDMVFDLHVDDRNRLWIGSRGGLSLLRPGTDSFTLFEDRPGRRQRVVLAITEDRQQRLWLSCDSGLTRFDLDTETFYDFHVEDGILLSYLRGATFAGEGRLYFGARNGLTVFAPNTVKPDLTAPRVILTDVRLSDRPLADAGHMDTLLRSGSISLSPDQRDLLFKFTALHYTAPARTRYAYHLEGIDRGWTYTNADRREATYTDLEPGSYRFRVKAASPSGIWNEVGTAVVIHIKTGFWSSPWVLLLYIVAAFLPIALLFWAFSQRQQSAHQEQINKELKAQNLSKDSFIVGASHDLRAPLVGIIDMVEALAGGSAGKLSVKVRNDLSLVLYNSKVLANMLNNILDFYKLRSGSLSLRYTAVDLHSQADVIFHLLSSLDEVSGVGFVNDIPRDAPLVEADELRLEQALFNLIQHIAVSTREGKIRISLEKRSNIRILIEYRAGREVFPQEYERLVALYGSDQGTLTQSGNLGLAITLRLIMLHGSMLNAREEDDGFCLFFDLPVSDRQERTFGSDGNEAHHVPPAEPSLSTVFTADNQYPPVEETHVFHVLIVDDDLINREALKNLLFLWHYRVTEASGGMEALTLLEDGRHHFDLVLLDIMMPRMSGYEVCERIRETWSSTQLPVIFLTAKGLESDLSSGFASGANDYLTKPFSKEELYARIGIHIQQTRHARELDSKNRELESLHRIIKIINREAEMHGLLQAILQQGMSLFPGAERGLFAIWNERRQCFLIEASVGFPPHTFENHYFSYDDLVRRYIRSTEELESGFFLTRHFKNDDVPEQLAHLEMPKELLSMPLGIKGKPHGFLLLGNYSDGKAFAGRDVGRLDRFREHAISALGRANALEALKEKGEQILQSQQQMMLQEKMASLGLLTAGVAHEINNPANFAHGGVQGLGRDLEHFRQFLLSIAGDDADPEIIAEIDRRMEPLFEHINTIREGTNRIKGVVTDLNSVSRMDGQHKVTVDLSQSLETTMHLARHNYGKQVRFVCEIEDYLMLECWPGELNQVFLNLMVNGCHAIIARQENEPQEAPRALTIVGQNQDESIRIEIRDEGCGIPENIRGKIFEPFFTTKELGQGTGLGLAIAFEIVKKHRGTISLESEVNQGTSFVVVLPRDPCEEGEP